jgi:hypothetical protein
MGTSEKNSSAFHHPFVYRVLIELQQLDDSLELGQERDGYLGRGTLGIVDVSRLYEVAVQGLMACKPQASKADASREATMKLREAAVAAI